MVKTNKIELVQFLIVFFTMSLLLSKHYNSFKLFSILCQGSISIISAAIGALAISVGAFMMLKAIIARG